MRTKSHKQGRSGSVVRELREQRDTAARDKIRRERKQREESREQLRLREQQAARERVARQQEQARQKAISTAKAEVAAAEEQHTAALGLWEQHKGVPFQTADATEQELTARIAEYDIIITAAKARLTPTKSEEVAVLRLKGFAPVPVVTFTPPPDEIAQPAQHELTVAEEQKGQLVARLKLEGLTVWQRIESQLRLVVDEANRRLATARKQLAELNA